MENEVRTSHMKLYIDYDLDYGYSTVELLDMYDGSSNN